MQLGDNSSLCFFESESSPTGTKQRCLSVEPDVHVLTGTFIRGDVGGGRQTEKQLCDCVTETVFAVLVLSSIISQSSSYTSAFYFHHLNRLEFTFEFMNQGVGFIFFICET